MRGVLVYGCTEWTALFRRNEYISIALFLRFIDFASGISQDLERDLNKILEGNGERLLRYQEFVLQSSGLDIAVTS